MKNILVIGSVGQIGSEPVSYTHLTMPTNYTV